jgi:uncharacterized protein (TIGR03086 family)
MPQIDLHPAARQVAALVQAVPDDALTAPTPCADMSVDLLVQHIGGLAQAFAAAARKDRSELTGQPPRPTEGDLEDGWRARIATDLGALGDAWDAPDAWDGIAQIGGLELPGEMVGLVGLGELVVHGWDLAQATREAGVWGDDALQAVAETVRQIRAGNTGEIPGLFGAVVPVADDAAPLDQVLSLTGRDPGWEPPAPG